MLNWLSVQWMVLQTLVKMIKVQARFVWIEFVNDRLLTNDKSLLLLQIDVYGRTFLPSNSLCGMHLFYCVHFFSDLCWRSTMRSRGWPLTQLWTTANPVCQLTWWCWCSYTMPWMLSFELWTRHERYHLSGDHTMDTSPERWPCYGHFTWAVTMLWTLHLSGDRAMDTSPELWPRYGHFTWAVTTPWTLSPELWPRCGHFTWAAVDTSPEL